MICPRCQYQLPDNSVACNRCGLTFQYQMPPQQPQPVRQKKSLKKLIIGLVCGIVGAILLAFIIPLIISYLPKEIDYGDAQAFEKALNEGKNVNGAVVRFEVKEYKYTLLGDNIWAGQHLNFYGNIKNASKGDIVTVKIRSVKDFDGSWMIRYRRVNNGRETSNTIKSE